jgi:SAM-dependent methyltransferase
MNVSKLDEIYSLSSSFTSKEMTLKIPGYALQSQIENMEPSKYIDRFTGKAKSETVIYRSKCPLCDSEHFEFLFVKHGFDHVLCSKCDLIFTLQILDHERIKFLEVGNEGDNYGNYKSTSVVSDRDRKKYEIVFEELTKYTSIKKIFDIGSNAGMFLDWTKSKNYSVTGHEFHDKLRNDCISKGHSVLNENLDTIHLDEVDLITCWDYIDHVLNPKAMVENLGKSLKKDGLFFFAINNRDSLSARIMHERCPIFIGPHHTMHYGIKQLNLLMKDYELLYSESYVSELSWISNWLNFKNAEFGDSSLMKELLSPKKICELGMGFKVNAIYRKK